MRYLALDPSADVVEEPLPAPPAPAPSSTCLDCAGSIPAARLKAIPTAIRCTACQLLYESQAL